MVPCIRPQLRILGSKRCPGGIALHTLCLLPDGRWSSASAAAAAAAARCRPCSALRPLSRRGGQVCSSPGPAGIMSAARDAPACTIAACTLAAAGGGPSQSGKVVSCEGRSCSLLSRVIPGCRSAPWAAPMHSSRCVLLPLYLTFQAAQRVDSGF
jgi:hypothetical protein